jgi:hypothetical protein
MRSVTLRRWLLVVGVVVWLVVRLLVGPGAPSGSPADPSGVDRHGVVVEQVSSTVVTALTG